MPIATIVESVLFYDDTGSTSNPQRKLLDWKRTAAQLSFDEVYSEHFSVAPGATKTVESSVGAVNLSSTPVNLVQGVNQATWYQFRGAFPSSPWALSLAISGQPLTITQQVDGSVFVSGAGLAALTSVVPGDWVYLAGTGYGDTGPVASANQGFWEVVAVSSGLTLKRIYDNDTSATETVTTGSVDNIQHLPTASRPRWLFVRGGQQVYAGLWSVVGAAKGWIAVVSETGFVPATAITFERLVTSPKFISYVRIETDQPVTALVGDVAGAVTEVSMQPVVSGSIAWHESFAFVTSLAVKNGGGAGLANINLVYALLAQE